MKIREWDKRYRSCEEPLETPSPLLVETAQKLKPGRALDLACGAGRNAVWLAEHRWNVTAVDGSSVAIEILRNRASTLGVSIDAKLANLEAGEFRIEPGKWDLIAMCFYLQRDLLGPAQLGLAPGGVLIAIVHITEPGEEPTAHRLRPGELAGYFRECEILHTYEGQPHDPTHRRSVAEIVVRR